MIKRVESSIFDTKLGEAELVVYKEELQGASVYHYAILFGNVHKKKDVFCRIHSACITSESFAAVNCDCREQLTTAMELAKEREGLVIYLQQEGRGNGIEAKIMQMKMENSLNIDTIDAFQQCGFPVDNRSYDVAGFILKDLGVQSIQLYTANPDKLSQLDRLGIVVTKRIHPQVPIEHAHAIKNIKAKQKKLHYFTS